MSATKAIAKLLKLHSILKIAGVRFRRDGALMRPAVGQSSSNPPVARPAGGGSRGQLGYAPREIVCRTHGRTEEEIWAARHARVSYRFEYAVLRLCKVMTQKAAAQLLQMPASTLSDQLHRSNAIVVAIVCGDFGSSASPRSPYRNATSTRRWSMTWSARSSCGSDRAAAGPPSTSFSTSQLSDYQQSNPHRMLRHE